MLALNKHSLSWFIVRRAPGGVTPSTIPYMTDENLAKVHRTPLVKCEPPLQSLSRSHGENFSGPNLAWIARDTTPTSYINSQWSAGPPCGAYPVSLARNPLRSQPSVDHKRHNTYMIHYSLSLIHSWRVKPIHAYSFTSDPWSIRLVVNYIIVHTYSCVKGLT
jgi:hypothetical protein